MQLQQRVERGLLFRNTDLLFPMVKTFSEMVQAVKALVTIPEFDPQAPHGRKRKLTSTGYPPIACTHALWHVAP